jgi:hypothetical protein
MTRRFVAMRSRTSAQSPIKFIPARDSSHPAALSSRNGPIPTNGLYKVRSHLFFAQQIFHLNGGQ